MALKNRKAVEDKVLKFMQTLDKSGTNTEYYKNLFKGMNDKEFYDFFKNIKFPIRVHTTGFDNNISLNNIRNALKSINVPFTEKVNLNYIYKDENGNAVQTNECTVGYLHIPKMRQMNVKKSENGTDVSTYNPKTGELTGDSKVVSISDREFEASAIFGLNNTIKEMITFRSDDVDNFNLAYNAIITKGTVNHDDLNEEYNNLSRRALAVSLICCQLDTNLI